ncbi:hypothetical protein ACJX0J_019245, partial [Zea mays]
YTTKIGGTDYRAQEKSAHLIIHDVNELVNSIGKNNSQAKVNHMVMQRAKLMHNGADCCCAIVEAATKMIDCTG